MADIQELLRSAVRLHRDGQLPQAWELYQDVLQRDPRHAAALNAVGLLLRQSAKFDDALDYLRRAIAADPSQAAYHANLGETYRGMGKPLDAIDCYLEAVRLAPGQFVPHYHLATLYEQAEMPDEAIASHQKALALKPFNSAAGCALAGLFRRQGRLAEAEAAFRKVVAGEPANAEAMCELAQTLGALGRRDEALTWLKTAVERRPEFAAAHDHLAAALFYRGQLAESRQHCERAVELEPARHEFHFNLASLQLCEGRPDDAISSFDRALELESDYPQARCGRGTALLARGDFEQGWADYEARLHCPTNDVPLFSRPRWDGSPLEGRTLLIHGEQALGDVLQFVRYVRLARQRGKSTIVAVRPPLVPLLAQSGLGDVVSSADSLPPFDVYVPLLSLPHLLQTRLETVPRDVPYLEADPRRVEKWRAALQDYPGFRVGIVWQGGRAYSADHLRSIPLAAFAPLAEVPGVRLISLQKGAGPEPFEQLNGRFEVIDLADSLDNDGAAFVDTAAVMKNLDLVVTSDTATAHLAGALAVPVWTALSAAADWRWMLNREDSPWYPTMRLFRQTTLGDWSNVMERIAAELKKTAAAQ